MLIFSYLLLKTQKWARPQRHVSHIGLQSPQLRFAKILESFYSSRLVTKAVSLQTYFCFLLTNSRQRIKLPKIFKIQMYINSL